MDKLSRRDLTMRVVAACAVLAALSGCAGAQTAPAKTGTSMPITAIEIERNAFGTADASVLTLRADGRAVLVTPGNARLGVAERRAQAVLARPDFDALARTVVERGFFALDPRYEDATTADGEWTALRVERAGVWTEVVRREHEGPPALRAIEAAVRGLQQRLRFVAVPP
jgi:hypothetical protein